MKLTNPEKIAISSLLLEIIYADGTVNEAEIKLLMKLQNQLDISNQLMEQSKKVKSKEYFHTIREMHQDKKEFVADLIHKMIVADGNVDDEEVKVYNKFCEIAGFPLQTDGQAS